MGSTGRGTASQIGKAGLCKVLKGKLENGEKLSSQIAKDEHKEGTQGCRDYIKSEIDHTVEGGHKRHQEAVNQLYL